VILPWGSSVAVSLVVVRKQRDGNLGSLLIQTGDFTGARTVLDRALAINPYYVNAWLRRARLHAINSSFDAAYQAFDRVAKIDPDEPGVQAIRPVINELSSQ